jgi:hypothetical protein
LHAEAAQTANRLPRRFLRSSGSPTKDDREGLYPLAVEGNLNPLKYKINLVQRRDGIDVSGLSIRSIPELGSRGRLTLFGV